jgi:hypothetical protein
MKRKIANNSETVRNSICVTVTTIVGLGQAESMAQCTLTLTYIFKVKFLKHRKNAQNV